MAKFAKKTSTCLGCKVPLVKGEPSLCRHCKQNEQEIFIKESEKLNALEESFGKLWTQCQRCTGDLHHEVICTSMDCPIFYMRKKVQKDMNAASATIDRFESSW